MNGIQPPQGAFVGNVQTAWSIVGTGDFNGDGKGDILWRNTNGDVAMWLMNGTQLLSPGVVLGNVPTLGKSSAPAISTATARATFSGATRTATSRFG